MPPPKSPIKTKNLHVLTVRDVRPSSDPTVNRLLTSNKAVVVLEGFIQEALELGLKDPVLRRKTVADTVEAIQGTVYLDSGLKKVKVVMDALDLVSKARRLERILESEVLVIFDEHGIV